jgi:hypothetical protein
MFDPQPHRIKLPRKVKDRVTGHYTTVYDDYLEVKWRLCWFRDRYPHGVITTDEICVDLERGYALYRCVVEDGQGGRATRFGTETAADFADYCERAETRAIGRALAALGIGTQFVGQDLTEGEHVADAPVRPPVAQPVNGHGDALPAGDVPDFPPPTNGDAPPLTVVPTEADLPCGGQTIAALKPAQLAMLVSKVARLVQDQGGRWVPLLHALQAERASRLDRGQRCKVALVPPAATDGPDVPPQTVTTTGEG